MSVNRFLYSNPRFAQRVMLLNFLLLESVLQLEKTFHFQMSSFLLPAAMFHPMWPPSRRRSTRTSGARWSPCSAFRSDNGSSCDAAGCSHHSCPTENGGWSRDSASVLRSLRRIVYSLLLIFEISCQHSYKTAVHDWLCMCSQYSQLMLKV